MKRVLAIADDFTGAAEIAGIGWRYGMATRLVRQWPYSVADGLTVVDTDTRRHGARRAAEIVGHAIARVERASFDLLFKKVDSVMRGPIAAEVNAMLDVLQLSQAILLPQNPSRRRTIKDGIYRIDATLLEETEFARDPVHPIRSSRVNEILSDNRGRILIADASDQREIEPWCELVRRRADVLPAGGADFFTSLLRYLNCQPARSCAVDADGAESLIICGTASDSAADVARRAKLAGIPIFPMPRELFDNLSESQHFRSSWVHDVAGAVQRGRGGLMLVGQPRASDADTPAYLEQVLAQAVVEILEVQKLQRIFIEGGATAAAICRRAEWSLFEAIGELGPGIVGLRPQAHPTAPVLVVKPGSYLWPEALFPKSS